MKMDAKRTIRNLRDLPSKIRQKVADVAAPKTEKVGKHLMDRSARAAGLQP